MLCQYNTLDLIATVMDGLDRRSQGGRTGVGCREIIQEGEIGRVGI